LKILAVKYNINSNSTLFLYSRSPFTTKTFEHWPHARVVCKVKPLNCLTANTTARPGRTLEMAGKRRGV